ncbi:hypothetical protein AB3S75_018252 [Citrus x aurantiifolia]
MMKSYKFALEPTLKLGIKQARIVERNGNRQHWSHICCLGSSRLVGSHGGALINVKYFTEANAAASSISEMIYRVPNIGSDDKQGKILLDVEGDLEIKYIDFAYPSKQKAWC